MNAEVLDATPSTVDWLLVLVGMSQPLVALGVRTACEAAGFGVSAWAGQDSPLPTDAQRVVLVGDQRSLCRGAIESAARRGVGVVVMGDPVPGSSQHEAITAGARGFLDEGVGGQELVAAVREVAAGRLVLSPQMQRAAFAPAAVPPAAKLSPRETQVLEMMAGGLSAREIASELVIAEATVRTHLQRLGEKLGERRRTGMVARAARLGLI